MFIVFCYLQTLSVSPLPTTHRQQAEEKRSKRKPAAPPPPPLTSKRTRQTPAEKSVAKRVQQAMDLLQTGAMQFADVHGTGASIIFTERDGTFEVEIKRGDDDDATQD